MAENRYVHDTQIHRLNDAQVIVPLLIEMFSPKSVIDVGCGLGSFLKIFIDNNIVDVRGVEGKWLDKSKLLIDENYILTADIEKGFDLHRRFDLAICLEVAEHLHESNADNLIQNLTRLSDVVVFSAAIPYQGGQNHINEQWIDYWQELFGKYGFKMYDILRPLIWNHADVYWWYRQNIFVCIRESVKHEYTNEHINNYIHPELYIAKVAELNAYKQWIDKIFSGDIEIAVAKSILAKAQRNTD